MKPRSSLAIFSRVVPVLLALALCLADARTASAAGEKKLADANRAYNRGDYAMVIRLLRPLLHPAIRLSSEMQVIAAYRLLGISYIFEKDRTEAERQFMAILALQPDFRFDPTVDPVAAVELLDELKRRNAGKLKAIRERERLEAERRRRAEEARRRAADEARRRALQPGYVVERTVRQNPYWVSFVPLGAGQFQNGHRRKGYTLMGVQLSLGAVSLATGITAWTLYSNAPRTSSGKLKITVDEHNRLRGLTITQVVSGSLCLGAVVYGIIDALVYHRPQTVVERKLSIPPPRMSVGPLAAPGGAGVELGVTF